MQLDLANIGKCCDSNSVTVNEDKTKCMWFTSAQAKKNLLDIALMLNGNKLEEFTHYSYLPVGVELDSGSLARYISGTTSRVSNKIFKLAKLRSSLTEKAAIANNIATFRLLLLPSGFSKKKPHTQIPGNAEPGTKNLSQNQSRR